METNLKLETPLTEDEARAEYTKALTAFNAKCNTVEALRQELEEESVELTRLKGKVDQHSNAFLRAVERQELERKDDMPEAYEKADAIAEAKGKAESRTIGKIMGRTEAVQPRKPHSEDTKPMFAASDTRPEIAPDAPAYAAQEVSEADRDETAIAAEDDEAELAIPTPGQRRAENIANLTPERAAEAVDVLETVDNILSDD
jgi:hypothetical protein